MKDAEFKSSAEMKEIKGGGKDNHSDNFQQKHYSRAQTWLPWQSDLTWPVLT